MSVPVRIADVVAAHPFGRPSAAKRGRNPSWPFVPVIDFGEQKIGFHRTRTEQIRGKAYATRDEAVAYAQKVIDARRAHFAAQLAEPRMRAMRRQNGLPEEIAQVVL